MFPFFLWHSMWIFLCPSIAFWKYCWGISFHEFLGCFWRVNRFPSNSALTSWKDIPFFQDFGSSITPFLHKLATCFIFLAIDLFGSPAWNLCTTSQRSSKVASVPEFFTMELRKLQNYKHDFWRIFHVHVTLCRTRQFSQISSDLCVKFLMKLFHYLP